MKTQTKYKSNSSIVQVHTFPYRNSEKASKNADLQLEYGITCAVKAKHTERSAQYARTESKPF